MNWSLNSCEQIGACFKAMFPDSEVAQKFTLGRSKAAYVIYFGLAPFFGTITQNKVSQSPYYFISFDETLNVIIQKSQKDFMVR